MSRENLEKEGITLLGNQKVKYPDQNWCVIVYGGFEKYVSDESIASISDATPMQP